MKQSGTKRIGKPNKHYTLMIIPEKSGTSKSVSLSRYLFLVPFIVLTGITVFITLILAKYISLNKIHNKSLNYIDTLESKSQMQDKQLDDYKAIEQELKSKITTLEKLEKVLKEKIDQVTATEKSSLNTTEAKDILTLADMSIMDADLLISDAECYIKKIQLAQQAAARMPAIFPCLGIITSTFGRRNSPTSRGVIEFHNGIDISSAYGTKIKASADGIVTTSCYYGSYGNVVVIKHGNGYSTLYGHNSKLLVKKGQSVKKGDVISLMGSTGRSTGVHVHFEVLYNNTPINPYSIIKGGNN